MLRTLQRRHRRNLTFITTCGRARAADVDSLDPAFSGLESDPGWQQARLYVSLLDSFKANSNACGHARDLHTATSLPFSAAGALSGELLRSSQSWQTSQQRQLSNSGRSTEDESQETQSDSGSGTQHVPLPQTWLDDYLPKAAIPYALTMRLDKPIGTWLLAWPCFWSIAAAATPGHAPDMLMLTIFGTGAVLLRGAGCTVNDLWDRDLDAKVERTCSRPLASGALSPTQGLGLLGGQLLLGLGVLLQLNAYSIILGASSLVLVFTYPLMKRVTHWPQAFLGLTFNWGALLGYSAVAGACHWPTVLPLYAGGICWTLVYDTIYAHQDKHDDVVAGVKSTALLFGANTRPVLSAFATGATGLWATAGILGGAGPAFFVGVAAAGAHMGWQIWTVDLENRSDCMAKFVSNKWMGALMFGGIVADKLM